MRSQLESQLDPQINDLLTLSGLTDEDLTILSNLEEYARTLAPDFGEALQARLSARQYGISLDTGENEQIRQGIQDWFLQLFVRDKNCSELVDIRTRKLSNHQPDRPSNYLIALMEPILRYGYQVTQRSPQAEKAISAFQKLVALEIAVVFSLERNRQDHLREMILLD